MLHKGFESRVCWTPGASVGPQSTFIFLSTLVPLMGDRVVKTSDSQSREPEFESSGCCFKTCAILFNPHCHSSLSCINEYLAIARQRSRVGVGMNRYARGGSVDHFERSYWLNRSYRLNTALHMNILFLPFTR